MKFALIGNPNSGKTTLFNNLTGSTAHVGNWPGVTVEKKEGVYRKYKEPVTITDLPGIYSFSPYTPEEIVSRNYIIDGNADLIINIIDATNLERNLYLTLQVLETGLPVVLAVNMTDILHKKGIRLDTEILSRALGVPAVPISALRNEGTKELMEIAFEEAERQREGWSVLEDSPLKLPLETLLEVCGQYQIRHPVFHAVKLLEGDKIELGHGTGPAADAAAIKNRFLKDGKEIDYEAEIADLRYHYITEHLKGAVVKPLNEKPTRTEKIDKVLTHRIWGIPLFLLFMFAAFHVTFGNDFLFLNRFGAVGAYHSFLGDLKGVPSLGVFLQKLTGAFIEWTGGLLSKGMTLMGAAENGAAQGLVINGIFGGVGSVLTYVPQIMLLFLFLSFMEDTGYMARVAFITDRALKRFGLSGRALIPMLMGFGCSVPAIMGTRVLNDEKERKLTIMLMPFFSCGAKMPIWAAVTAAIYPQAADIMVFAVYLSGILIAVLMAVLLKNTLLRGGKPHFIMELPSYRMPQFKSVAIHLWEKLKGFIQRAATVIAVSAVVIWFLSSFTFGFKFVGAGADNTMLAHIGKGLRYLFIPLGFAGGAEGWKAVVAIFTGLIGKEAVVSTMGVLYGAGEGGLALAGAFTGLSAFTFMLFNLLCVPCMAAVAAARAELKNRKWFWLTLLLWLATAYAVCLLVYQIGRLF